MEGLAHSEKNLLFEATQVSAYISLHNQYSSHQLSNGDAQNVSI